MTYSMVGSVSFREKGFPKYQNNHKLLVQDNSMPLFNIEGIFPPKVDNNSNIVQYTAKMSGVCSSSTSTEKAHQAVLASNINILRRSAPFAYLFIDSYYSLQDWLDDEFGDTPDREYVLTFDTITLNRNFSLFNSGVRVDAPPTIIIAIISGDILPFIHTIESQDFSLLCLPEKLELIELENLIHSTSSEVEITDHLLDSGGIIISIPDGVVFTVLSKQTGIRGYFSINAT